MFTRFLITCFLLFFSPSGLVANDPLLITTIGSYPKPIYLPTPNWFLKDSTHSDYPTTAYDNFLKNKPKNYEKLVQRAIREVIDTQEMCGVDIPTDGELRRENYIHYHCRHLNGVDFSTLTKKVARENWVANLPTVTAPVSAKDPYLAKEWQISQSMTGKSLKATLPGPMTIVDSIADAFYYDEERLGEDLAIALNSEILALARSRCKVIQIDEPLFARKTEKALAYGITHLDQCLEGLPDDVLSIVHICCGYPEYLEQEDYPKADSQAYFKLADALDKSAVKAVSIEDAHRRNHPQILRSFKKTKVILGVLDISTKRIETVEEIQDHIKEALKYIDANRLLLAPDCGLGMLDAETATKKLTHLKIARDNVCQRLAIIPYRNH